MNFRIRHWSIPFLFLVVSGFFISRFSYGVDYETNRSTNPVSASTLAVVQYADPGDILGSILINTWATSAETIKIYDSSGIASGLIGTIDVSSGIAGVVGMGRTNEYVYNIRISSSITFTKSAGTSDLTIIWKDVR